MNNYTTASEISLWYSDNQTGWKFISTRSHMGKKTTTYKFNSENVEEIYKNFVIEGIELWGSAIDCTYLATSKEGVITASATPASYVASVKPPVVNIHGHIIEWEMIINHNNFFSNTLDNSFRKKVITHEIGHVYGLGDLGSDFPSHIMNNTANLRSANITSDDLNGMNVMTHTHVHSGSYPKKYENDASSDIRHKIRCTSCKAITYEECSFTISATCTTPKTCLRCPNIQGSVLEHSWGSWTITSAATCTMTGSQRRTCTRNTTHVDTQTIPINSTAHNWGSWNTTTAATCTTTGSQMRICTRNTTHIGTQTIPISSTTHNWGSWNTTTAATCTTSGSQRRTCTRNMTHVDTQAIPINSTAHNWGSWTTITAATCTTTGSQRRICTRNTAHVGTQTIPINSTIHNWGSWIITTAATCTTTGSQRRTCTRNTTHIDTQAIPINSTAHNWGIWTTVKAATCTIPGSQIRFCTRNSSHNQSQTLQMLNHAFSNPFIHNTTQHWKICSRNGCSIKNGRGNHIWAGNRCGVCLRIR